MSEDRLTFETQARRQIVETKITCPFLGSAVQQEILPVRSATDNPLAKIEDVRELGNTGAGSDLGDLLTVFAQGNHAFMRGASQTLDQPVPEGLFSLELPGSQGSHPGHSGILEGDPKTLGSGRLSNENFERLEMQAKEGLLTWTGVATFIAQNLQRDPDAKIKINMPMVAGLLTQDLANVLKSAAAVFKGAFFDDAQRKAMAERTLQEKLTKLLGEDNLVGSSGEFGLLFAFLANSPRTQVLGSDAALSLSDVRGMFVDKRLPDGWEGWNKSRVDWVGHTAYLLRWAHLELQRLSAG
jgi:hypothetical protein